MRLDRDSKQPIWLGLILIFAAFIFTLFFITSVRADDEVSEPPHDPQYNNLVFITVSDKMYIGGDTVIDFYSGSSDGANAIAWKSNFSSNLSGFFQYVPIDQCFFIIASDGASAGHLISIREVLSDLGASYWSGEQDGFWNPDHDLSGYEDQRAPFGIYNVRYMSRLVKYLPVVSPSPIPEVVDIAFSFFVYGTPFWSQSLVPSSSNRYFYLVDVYASGIYDNLDISLQGNTALASAMSNYGVVPPWVRPAVVKSFNSTNLVLYIYFSGTLYSVKIYTIGEVLPTHNMEFIRDNYTAIDWAINTEYGSSFFAGSSNGLNCVSLFFEGTSSKPPLYFDLSLSRYGIIELPNRPIANSSFNSCFSYSSSSLDNALTQGYRVGLDSSSEPDITPSPDPNAPSPTPSPTEAPHVIINWPSGTPTPTPPFSVPVQEPGGGSGSPGGSSQGSLTPGQVNTTLNTFKQYTQNNGAFAFLYACTGLIPDEALFFLFILLFILLLLACLRLFVHFTGG